VASPEGLPISYEVFAGNRADVTTVEEIAKIMEDKNGQARRIWVLDRGMISEENIEFLRSRQARYVVGTPKARLKGFEQQLLEQEDWHQVEPGVEIKLVAHPDGDGTEQFILCRSSARRQKEAAMLELQRQRLLAKLQQLDRSLAKSPRKNAGAVERRIGRWLGRHPAAEKLLDVEVKRNEQAEAVGLGIVERGARSAWPSVLMAPISVTNQLHRPHIRLNSGVGISNSKRPKRAFVSQKLTLLFDPSITKKLSESKPTSWFAFSPGALAHAGNVDAFQGTGQLRPSTGARSLYYSFDGYHLAGQEPWAAAPTCRCPTRQTSCRPVLKS
jgi:hypothetical protein